MVHERSLLTRGGVYLARLDPSKGAEVGKIQPVVVLNAQSLLDVKPPICMVCPLSKHSQPQYASFHIQLSARDNLKLTSFALSEHIRTITYSRLLFPRIAQLTEGEVGHILHAYLRILGL